MRKIIIAIGKMRSGKDEFYHLLHGMHLPFVRRGFADKVKEYVAKLEGVSTAEIEAKKAQYREKLIFAGNLGRLIHEDTWAVKLFENFNFLSPLIITDCRYPNEIEVARKYAEKFNYEVTVVRISATDETRLSRGAQKEFFDNISEVSLDGYVADVTIENNGTMQEFRHKVLDFYQNHIIYESVS